MNIQRCAGCTLHNSSSHSAVHKMPLRASLFKRQSFHHLIFITDLSGAGSHSWSLVVQKAAYILTLCFQPPAKTVALFNLGYFYLRGRSQLHIETLPVFCFLCDIIEGVGFDATFICYITSIGIIKRFNNQRGKKKLGPQSSELRH